MMRMIFEMKKQYNRKKNKLKSNWLFALGCIFGLLGMIAALGDSVFNITTLFKGMSPDIINKFINMAALFIVLSLLFIYIHFSLNPDQSNPSISKDITSIVKGNSLNDSFISLSLSNRITDMFHNAGIYKYNFIIDTNVPNAECNIIDGVPCIKIRSDYFKELNDDLICFIIGHEIGHVVYDFNKIKGKLSVILIYLIQLVSLVIIFSLALLGFRLQNEYIILLSVLMLLFYTIIDSILNRVFDNRFFIDQIKELRADRYGFRLAGLDKSHIPLIASYIFKNSEIKDHRKKKSTLLLILAWFHLLPKSFDLHPVDEIRKQELSNHYDKPWGMIDDLRYAWKFTIGFLLRKDWMV